MLPKIKKIYDVEPQMKYEKFKLFIYRLSNGFSFLPFQFTLNICNICNRKCKFCPNWGEELRDTWYLRWIRKQPDLMDYDKFADMLKRMGILRHLIITLSFTGRGDPTLHPDLIKFCQLANKYKIPFTITSNGDKMDDDFFEEMGKLKYCKWIRVSLFNVERAKYWLNMQAKHKVNITFINETGYHLDGYDDGFISANNPANEKYSTMPLNFVKENYCRAPFSFNTLNTDGTIVTCITFFEVGNAFNQSFWSILNSKKMRLIRKQALAMEIPEHLADCKNCGNFMRLPKYQAMNKYKKFNRKLKKEHDS